MMLLNWLKAMLYVLLCGTIFLAIAPTILGMDMKYSELNYLTLFVILAVMIYVARKISEGEM